ncbi:MAG: hypothetical protein LC754_14260 [Acidobacteria bacterium]|nr:hypothetical protein [Acidobacteriota bacterium]
MRNLMKSMISFSWAMPLFGIQQMGNLLRQPGSVSKALNSVTDAVHSELDCPTRTIFKAGDTLQRWTVDTMFSATPDVQTLPYDSASPSPVRFESGGSDRRASGGYEEETIVCQSLGTGTVRHGIDGRAYFIVHGQLAGVDRALDGEFEGVWAAKVFTPQDLVSYPDLPLLPFDRPFKPGEEGWNPQLNPTKSRWNFGQDRAYERVRGQATSMGSAHFPAPPQTLEAISFELNAVHVLKVVPLR